MNFKFGYRVGFGGKEEKRKKNAGNVREKQREYFLSDYRNQS